MLSRRLLTAVVLILFAGCFRQVTDETAAPVRPRYTGTEPWTIEGVRPGQSFEVARKRFGEPAEIRGAGSVRIARWEQRETSVVFNEAGIVTEVMGSTVEAGDQVLFRAGASEAEVTQILGPGKVRKVSQPKGGVISLGRKHTGTNLIYDNDGVRFELPVFGETSGRFLARRAP